MSVRAAVASLLFLLIGLSLASSKDGEPGCSPDRGKVLWVTAEAPWSSDLERLGDAGVAVLVRKGPTAGAIRAALDRGEEVSVLAHDFSSSDLRDFAGRKGRVTLRVTTSRHGVSDLVRARQAGAAIQIEGKPYSVSELVRIATE